MEPEYLSTFLQFIFKLTQKIFPVYRPKDDFCIIRIFSCQNGIFLRGGTIGQYRRKLTKGYRWYYLDQFLGNRYVSKGIYHTKQECKMAESEKLKEHVYSIVS